jgi:hypothetical protein
VGSGWFSLVEENTYVLESDRKACEVEVSEAVALAEEESAFSLVEGASEVFLENGQVICDELR